MLLSVVTPTLHSRKRFFDDLYNHLIPQLTDEVEWLVLADRRGMSLGRKMNLLYSMAQGEYITTLNDDDMIPDNYIDLMLSGCRSGKDVVIGKVYSKLTNNPEPIQIQEYLGIVSDEPSYLYDEFLNVMPAKAGLVRKYMMWDESFERGVPGHDIDLCAKLMASNPSVHKMDDILYFHAVSQTR